MKNIKYKILSNSCQVVYGNSELDVLSRCVKIVGSIFVLLCRMYASFGKIKYVTFVVYLFKQFFVFNFPMQTLCFP